MFSYDDELSYGQVVYLKTGLNLEILDQHNIVDDGYNRLYTYDDCILNNLIKNLQYSNFKKVLRITVNETMTIGIEESVFRNHSNKLEQEVLRLTCNAPDTSLQTTFTMANRNRTKQAGFDTDSGLYSPIFFDLEFPISTIVNKVPSTLFSKLLLELQNRKFMKSIFKFSRLPFLMDSLLL